MSLVSTRSSLSSLLENKKMKTMDSKIIANFLVLCRKKEHSLPARCNRCSCVHETSFFN